MANQKKIEIFYHRHSHLAEYYASKIFNEDNISMEKEDIVQELRLKLWTSIKSYIEKWQEWKETNRMKPVPLPFYLKTAMINRSKDFIREINKVKTIPMSQINFDYGQEDFPIEVDFLNNKLMVGVTDVLESLSRDEKKFFMLYFKGFTISKINRIYKGKMDPKVCMRINLEKIRKMAPLLIEEVNEYKYLQYQE